MLMDKAESDSGMHVDLTPVIDMVFLLLIFFLVATTFQQAEREMRIALPAAEAAGPISIALREIVINVDEAGAIIVGGRTISEDDLRTMVTEAVRANPEQKVSVRADQGAAYGTVARVLDICKAAGADQPFLDTVPIR
ncbi:MAG: biopolymer transporter ExbD [Phycisphaerales bacterium]